jgi:hypothetical protein
MRSEVIAEVKMSMLFLWVATPCRLNPEDGDSMFLRNVGKYLGVYTASQPRGTTSIFRAVSRHGKDVEMRV